MTAELVVSNENMLSDIVIDSDNRERITPNFQKTESKSFTISSTVNPLVALALPILTVASNLSELAEAPNLSELQHDLSYEISAFENAAHARGYRSQLILAARYQLCAFIDECIMQSIWGKRIEWHEHSLLQQFQHEAWGGERFFLILDRCLEDARLYIDMLELSFFCLKSGYKGKFLNEQHDELIHIHDKLYRTIRHQRGEMSKQLLIAAPSTLLQHHSWTNYLPGPITVMIVTLGIAFGLFGYFEHKLNQNTAPVNQMIKNLASTKT